MQYYIGTCLWFTIISLFSTVDYTLKHFYILIVLLMLIRFIVKVFNKLYFVFVFRLIIILVHCVTDKFIKVSQEMFETFRTLFFYY